MRKAVWGAILLGVFAASAAAPVREVDVLHRVLGLASLAGYLLLSFDPPVAVPLQRRLLLAGILCAVATFLLAVATLADELDPLVRLLGVATIALPLWLAAGPARHAFFVAGAFALFTGLPAIRDAGPYATSVHMYVAGAAALFVAALLHRPTLLVREKKKPRVVVASNIVTLTPEEKARALARLEKRYRDGELEEHVYLDKRQEIESR